MSFIAQQLVTKISVSNMLASKFFYENILGFELDKKYTINVNSHYDTDSYMQLSAPCSNGRAFTLGLFKDIDKPYDAMPQNGTVPSFIVDDIHTTLHHFLEQGVVVVPAGKTNDDQIDYIIQNTSDDGYVDLFFFFCDPDNNSLVIRQNLGKKDV